MATTDIHATVHADAQPAKDELAELEAKVREVESAFEDLNDTLAEYDGVSVEFTIDTEDN